MSLFVDAISAVEKAQHRQREFRNREEKEFWMAAYLAAIRTDQRQWADMVADAALRTFRDRKPPEMP